MRLLVAAALLAMASLPAADPAAAKKLATYECNDGVDNDGDGYTDYGDDPACWAPYVDTEIPECSDGIDNDGNGLIDYPDDADVCFSPEVPVEQDVPATECSDGYDNDLDWKIDAADPDCSSPSDDSESRTRRPRP